MNLVELLFDLHQVGGRGVGEFGREPSVCHQRIDIHTVLILLFRIHNVQWQNLDIIFIDDLRCNIRRRICQDRYLLFIHIYTVPFAVSN